jgi:DNA-directed RNA polymerase subunit M/transcription elongation factor TFIIS
MKRGHPDALYALCAPLPFHYSNMRAKGQQRMLEVVQNPDVAAALEEGVAAASVMDGAAEYYTTLSLLAHAVHINPALKNLREKAVLVPQAQLAPHAPIERFHAATREREAKLAALLDAADKADAGEDTQYRCRKCGSRVNVSPEQTRSADEGMTVFVTCRNTTCRHREVRH